MKLNDWETVIHQMMTESANEPRESGKHRNLMGWRARLELEPHCLKPFQIDEIVRQVQNRLTNMHKRASVESQDPILPRGIDL